MPVESSSPELKDALRPSLSPLPFPEAEKTSPNIQLNPPQQSPTSPKINAGQRTPYVPPFNPQLRALLESQIKTPPPHLTRPSLRRLTPKIDALNSWLRPLHPSRVKNQTKEWYADTLSKVHAPLPLHEWERLRDLASGARTEGMRPRRTAVVEERRGALEMVGEGRSALEMVVMYGKVGERKVFGNRDAHAITPRFMRRLWGQVFTQCPLMEWSGDTARWKALGVGHGVQQHAPAVERKEAATTG
ncbi:hypothetical protein LTR15_002328 [Elasticomyces elasticus]|nr:hypothetical protein LTR15_002328 [Elasticomyces elasticus]